MNSPWYRDPLAVLGVVLAGICLALFAFLCSLGAPPQ